MDGTAFSSDYKSSAALQGRRVNKKATVPRLRRSAASTTASSWGWVLRITTLPPPFKRQRSFRLINTDQPRVPIAWPRETTTPLALGNHLRQVRPLHATTNHLRNMGIVPPAAQTKNMGQSQNGEESARDPTDGVTVKGSRGCIELKG